MYKMTSSLYLLPCLLLGACVTVPPGAYYNHGDPENLLDVSSEVIHVALASKADVQELSRIVRDDPPTSAQLSCSSVEDLCAQAARVLDSRDVPASYSRDEGDEHGQRSVALVYERVVARDCENRYIDDTRNNHNLPPPTMGCSITSNMVQMATDKRQFTNPNLMDYQDAEKAAQVYGAYANPPAKQDTTNNGQSLLQTISTE
jgi:hypothetical protein